MRLIFLIASIMVLFAADIPADIKVVITFFAFVALSYLHSISSYLENISNIMTYNFWANNTEDDLNDGSKDE